MMTLLRLTSADSPMTSCTVEAFLPGLSPDHAQTFLVRLRMHLVLAASPSLL